MLNFLLGMIFSGFLANIFFLSGKKTKENETESAIRQRIDAMADNQDQINIPIRQAQIIRKLTPAQKALKEDE